MLTRRPVHISSAWSDFSNNKVNCGSNQTAGYCNVWSIIETCKNAAAVRWCSMNKRVVIGWCHSCPWKGGSGKKNISVSELGLAGRDTPSLQSSGNPALHRKLNKIMRVILHVSQSLVKCPRGPTTAAQQRKGKVLTQSLLSPYSLSMAFLKHNLWFLFFYFLGLKRVPRTAWMPVRDASLHGFLPWVDGRFHEHVVGMSYFF